MPDVQNNTVSERDKAEQENLVLYQNYIKIDNIRKCFVSLFRNQPSILSNRYVKDNYTDKLYIVYMLYFRSHSRHFLLLLQGASKSDKSHMHCKTNYKVLIWSKYLTKYGDYDMAEM
jgi:hypothetical protein